MGLGEGAMPDEIMMSAENAYVWEQVIKQGRCNVRQISNCYVDQSSRGSVHVDVVQKENALHAAKIEGKK